MIESPTHEYAILDGGVIVTYRRVPDLKEFPTYKLEATDDKGDGGPVYRAKFVEGYVGPNPYDEKVIVEKDRVRFVRTERPVNPETKSAALEAVRANVFKLDDLTRAVMHLQKVKECEALQAADPKVLAAMTPALMRQTYPLVMLDKLPDETLVFHVRMYLAYHTSLINNYVASKTLMQSLTKRIEDAKTYDDITVVVNSSK